MKKLLVILLIVGLPLIFITGCNNTKAINVNSEGILTLKVAHDSAATVPVAIGLAKFQELVETKSNRKILIEVYNNGQLGSATDYVVNCQLGTLDMAVVNQSVLSSFISDLPAVDIPYIIEGYEHADSIFMGEVGDYYKKEIKDTIGIETLGIWEVGFRNLTNSRHAVESVEDVKGLRIRTMDNKVHQEFWKSLGADPVPMSWNEAYTAMQQGAIDGQENPLSVILGNNVAEVNKKLAITEHVYSSIFFIMSKQAWQFLSDEQKSIITECALEAGIYEREEQRKQANDSIEKLKELGMEVTYPDKQQFIDATAIFREETGEKYSTIVDMIERAK